MKNFLKTKTAWAVSTFIVMNLAMIGNASAHCDGMDGPVITEAKAAIERRDVTPLLKWVPQSDERELKSAFTNTLRERSASKASPDAVDKKFYATLVRIHRKSEGAPFTGIKPAGQIEPIVAAADTSLKEKNVDHVVEHVLTQLEKSVRDKFAATVRSKEHVDESVEHGREFVANYVQFVHFVEALNNMATEQPEHQAADKKASGHAH